ncbi:hypothetical protein HDF16_004916 [Granulicella aggregans]|uniref:Uncharacterized protein n=1 Tax=Granulicella aggregans TaxID=474949 RepID=A0A7W7ZHT3_9BACT|nr:hypothetical protein [Granulicella aggregans]
MIDPSSSTALWIHGVVYVDVGAGRLGSGTS